MGIKGSSGPRRLPITILEYLRWVEIIGVTVVLVACTLGAFSFAWRTNFTMTGMLTAIDERWKGALILGAPLLFRTLLEMLSKAKPIHDIWSDWGPSGAAETVDRRPRKGAKASAGPR